MWLASPSASHDDWLMYARYDGYVYEDYYYYYTNRPNLGLRPLVCLKSDTKLERLDDGTFKIIKPPVTAEDISKVPSSYYGAEVVNYDAPHEGVDKWRIFYADDTNVYLIADDYIAGENAPNGKNGSKIYIRSGSNYHLGFSSVYNDYSGASWISENSKGSKWLSQFLGSYGSSTNINIKAVAYMMDTNVWSAYYADEYAEYAMGGPTLEMFCASYKDTHPSKYLECGKLNSSGYSVAWNGGSWGIRQYDLVKDDFNSIYIKTNTSKAEAMWLASPSSESSASYNDMLHDARYDGSVGSIGINSGRTHGLRPIVCLKSDTKLERLDDGTFKIIKPPVTADDISKAPADYYGAEVTNYEAPRVGVDKWRIFYADDTNVYLIADDYIAVTNVPNGKNGTSITQYEDSIYRLNFSNVINDYSGEASWISENSKGTKWLSEYLSAQGSSTNENLKAVSYMMDTNVWSAYYAGEYAEYAMGGPTIEMYCTSYKLTHTTEYLEYGNITSNGYDLKWNDQSWGASLIEENVNTDFNEIYTKASRWREVPGMYIASPADEENHIFAVDADGYMHKIGYGEYSSNGLRPIVCLKSGVQLEKQADGTFMIVK